MSNTKTFDKAFEYSGATGMLSAIIEELLISDIPLPKENVAKLLVHGIEELRCPPEPLNRLKGKLKQKYNL